jgi:3-isopropylmalate dehydrogenase
MANKTLLILPGDGIGIETMNQVRRIIDWMAKKRNVAFDLREGLIGGSAYDAHGTPLSDETLADALAVDAVLLGAVGGPKWDDPSAAVRPEQGLLGIRKALGLFANLRPVAPHPALADASPLRPERIAGVDLLVVRELTGGIYFGVKGLHGPPGQERARDVCAYTTEEIERIVRVGAELARARRGRLTSVDKANVLETSRLWRRVATRVVAEEFPDVALEHALVDSCAMQLVANPARFDVIVTENMFGDILTDEAAVIAGSIGVLPSASLGASDGGRRVGLYEPIHGSAPDIAGKGLANPVGTILSAALLLRHSLGMDDEARAIERAVHDALADGARTKDLGGSLSTTAMTDAVLARLEAPAAAPATA